MTEETLGAFVTIDINMLDKEQLILLGMKQMLDKYAAMIEAGSKRLAMYPEMMQEIYPLLRCVQAERDAVTLELVRGAERNKSATIRTIPKKAGI